MKDPRPEKHEIFEVSEPIPGDAERIRDLTKLAFRPKLVAVSNEAVADQALPCLTWTDTGISNWNTKFDRNQTENDGSPSINHFWVIKDGNGNLLGFSQASCIKTDIPAKYPDNMYMLRNCYVESSFQDQGIGKALIDKAMEWMISKIEAKMAIDSNLPELDRTIFALSLAQDPNATIEIMQSRGWTLHETSPANQDLIDNPDQITRANAGDIFANNIFKKVIEYK